MGLTPKDIYKQEKKSGWGCTLGNVQKQDKEKLEGAHTQGYVETRKEKPVGLTPGDIYKDKKGAGLTQENVQKQEKEKLEGAYTQGLIKTQKRKLGGAYFKDVHKQGKQKQRGDYTKGCIEIRKRKDGGGLHPEVFTNRIRKVGGGLLLVQWWKCLFQMLHTYISID